MHGGTQPPCIGVWLITATNWWLRSPNTNNTTNVWNVNTNGSYNNNSYSNTYGVRPALMDTARESSLSAKTAPHHQREPYPVAGHWAATNT